jgi:hypothetical protein
MAEVNSRGESPALESNVKPTALAKVHSCLRKTAGFLCFCGRIAQRRGCPHRPCWRRERNCRQTLSALFQ